MSGVEETSEYPPLRPIAEILSAMGRLRDACGTAADDATITSLFNEGLTLLLEIRVPRVPDTEEELLAMIEDGRDGPWLTSEQVMDGLRESGRRFSLFLDRYRGLVAACRWEDAARALMPAGRGDGVTWGGRAYTLEAGDGDATLVDASSVPLRKVSGSGTGPGTAALSAIIAAHIAWREVWHR